MKQFVLMCLVAAGLVASLPDRAHGMGRKSYELSMAVLPANHALLQVAFDLADIRPLILVTYQASPNRSEPLLHAWNGSEWVYVSLEDYRNADFLARLPARILLVGKEILPPVLVDASSWVPNVWQLPASRPDELLNAMDPLFRFTRAEWEYFAARYSMELKDRNAGRRGDSWYFHPYVEPEKAPIEDLEGPMAEPLSEEEVEAPSSVLPADLPPLAPLDEGTAKEDPVPVRPVDIPLPVAPPPAGAAP